MKFNPDYIGGIMSEKKIKATKRPRALSAPVLVYEAQEDVKSSIHEPVFPEDEIRQNAKAILNILTYIEREAHVCNFVELSLILGTAHISATELVQSFNEG
jgi:hypothetical protein